MATAELRNWEKVPTIFGYIYCGNIYGDAKGRWPDGKFIYTSLVMNEKEADDHILVTTLNSTYRMNKKPPAKKQAVKTDISIFKKILEKETEKA